MTLWRSDLYSTTQQVSCSLSVMCCVRSCLCCALCVVLIDCCGVDCGDNWVGGGGHWWCSTACGSTLQHHLWCYTAALLVVLQHFLRCYTAALLVPVLVGGGISKL